MIEWNVAAQQLGYENELALLTDYYIVRKLSVAEIAEKLDVSRHALRSTLCRLGIEIRGRGGPNNKKLAITDELVEEIRVDGIAAVAKKLGLSYTTVYKRLYHVRGLTVAKLAAMKPLGTVIVEVPPEDVE
jgi:transposase-like protein